MTTRGTSKFDHEAEHRRSRSHHNHKRKHRLQPCGSNIPNAPIVNLFSIIDTDKNVKNDKWTLKVDWFAVTEAQNGDDVDVDHYAVQVRGYKANGTTQVYLKTFIVHGTGDDTVGGTDDPPTRFVHDAILKRNRKYQVRVRAAARKRGCPGSWSAWSSLISVGGTTTPNRIATIVTDTTPDDRRVEFDWDDSDDPEFDRYKVEVYYGGTAGTASWEASPRKTAYTRQSCYRYAVPSALSGGWFRAKVYVQSEPDDNGNRTTSSASDASAGAKSTTGSSGTTTLAGLTDVNVVSPQGGEALRYNSGTGKWENANIKLSDLAQSSATTAGQVARWSGSAWAASKLSLGDLAQSSASTGDFAKWNGSSWVAANVPLGSIQQGGAATGELLYWNGASWAPINFSSGGFTASYANFLKKTYASTPGTGSGGAGTYLVDLWYGTPSGKVAGWYLRVKGGTMTNYLTVRLT